MAAIAVDARKRFNRNHRFRGRGPLLQKRGSFQQQNAYAPIRGIRCVPSAMHTFFVSM